MSSFCGQVPPLRLHASQALQLAMSSPSRILWESESEESEHINSTTGASKWKRINDRTFASASSDCRTKMRCGCSIEVIEAAPELPGIDLLEGPLFEVPWREGFEFVELEESPLCVSVSVRRPLFGRRFADISEFACAPVMAIAEGMEQASDPACVKGCPTAVLHAHQGPPS